MPTRPTISDSSTEEELNKTLVLIRKKEKELEHIQQAKQMGISYARLENKPIPMLALRIIPKETAEKLKVIPYYKDAALLKIGAVNPQDPAIAKFAQDLQASYQTKVNVDLISDASFAFGLNEYDYLPPEDQGKKLAISEEQLEKLTKEISDFRDIGTMAHRTSLSELLNLIFAAALKTNASDIHFQPEEKEISIRFRIDGVLHNICTIDYSTYIQVKKRVKLVSKLKLNIEDKPQDGTFTITFTGKNIDARVSTLPTNFGESIVIRILNPAALQLEFSNLGVRGSALSLLHQEIQKPNGLIVSCGPTGSGKTTTLYTILQALNEEGQKIITLENPVEYKLSGILQTQIDTERMTFAQGLKSALRQDPDIIMVGEIRDLETAETAINAALTGHLVITTLHTNDAAGAIPRFISMGIKPFLLGPSLNIIIGQRLCRRLCQSCKKPTPPAPEYMKRVKKEIALIPDDELEKENLSAENLTFYEAAGCEKCSGLGMKGRIGLFEVLKITDELADIIQEHEGIISENRIRELTHKQQMVTIVQDGIIKAALGITSLEEMFRVAD